MNEANELRSEAAAMKRKADAIEHTPMTEQQWSEFGDISFPAGGAAVLNAWNDSFKVLHDRAQLMRREALYWRERYNEIASPSETPTDG